jgi:hypothetical protein
VTDEIVTARVLMRRWQDRDRAPFATLNAERRRRW